MACGNFTSRLAEASKTAVQGREAGPLQCLSLPARSTTIENILPAAYRRPVHHLRPKPYGELIAALELAYYLDLSTSVELLAVYLEAQ